MFTCKLALAVIALAPLAAGAYETGNLTCDNIGQLAGQTLSAKQSGIPQDVYLSALNERLPGDAQVERKLVAAITTIIYQNDLLSGMKPGDAYIVFRQDCLRGMTDDGGSTDQDQRSASPAEDDEQTGSGGGESRT